MNDPTTTPEKWFTLQVKLSSGEVHELKDLTGIDIKGYKETIFMQGFRIQTSPIAWEFISPYRINTVMVMQQPHKFITD